MVGWGTSAEKMLALWSPIFFHVQGVPSLFSTSFSFLIFFFSCLGNMGSFLKTWRYVPLSKTALFYKLLDWTSDWRYSQRMWVQFPLSNKIQQLSHPVKNKKSRYIKSVNHWAWLIDNRINQHLRGTINLKLNHLGLSII